MSDVLVLWLHWMDVPTALNAIKCHLRVLAYACCKGLSDSKVEYLVNGLHCFSFHYIFLCDELFLLENYWKKSPIYWRFMRKIKKINHKSFSEKPIILRKFFIWGVYLTICKFPRETSNQWFHMNIFPPLILHSYLWFLCFHYMTIDNVNTWWSFKCFW